MYASYVASKTVKQVIIHTTPALTGKVKTITVSGKAEAREVAAQHSAQCWNF